jgi:outer membrane protein, heavy metal efflux system
MFRSLHRASAVAALALFLTLIARTAVAVESPTISLSLKDAIERAQAQAPEVVLAGRAVREAAARRVGAGIVLPTNPRLQFDVRPGVNQGTDGHFGYSSILDFLFDLGGAPRARVREAEGGVNVAKSELVLERFRARLAVWSAYLHARIAETRVIETKALAEIAASGDIEQSLAQTEVAELNAAIEDGERERETYVSQVRDALDIAAVQSLELTTALEEPREAPEPQQLAQRALAARPEFDVVRKRISLLEASEERLSRELFPKIGAYVGVDAAPLSPVFGVVGLSVDIPIIQRNQGPRAVVQATRETELQRLELLGRRVIREVMTSLRAFTSRRAQLREITERALPAAERTMQLVESGWRSGRFDLFRVTSAARDLTRVRKLRLDALEAAWMDRIALDRAVGGLDR